MIAPLFMTLLDQRDSRQIGSLQKWKSPWGADGPGEQGTRGDDGERIKPQSAKTSNTNQRHKSQPAGSSRSPPTDENSHLARIAPDLRQPQWRVALVTLVERIGVENAHRFRAPQTRIALFGQNRTHLPTPR